MYYIYTVEDMDGGVYVGCTQDPLQRMNAHLSNRDTSTSRYLTKSRRFFLRYQTESGAEACDIETRLVREISTVNTNTPAKLVNTNRSNIRLSAKLRSHSPVKTFRVSMLGGKRPSVYYKRKWKVFNSVVEAEEFISSL